MKTAILYHCQMLLMRPPAKFAKATSSSMHVRTATLCSDSIQFSARTQRNEAWYKAPAPETARAEQSNTTLSNQTLYAVGHVCVSKQLCNITQQGYIYTRPCAQHTRQQAAC
jgi:hypothetical protein